MSAIDLWRRRNPSTLRSWNPFMRDIERLSEEMDRLFGVGNTEDYSGFAPVCDLDETNENYVISMDVPGIDKDDIDIEVAGNTVRVSGERRLEQESGEGSRRQVERSFGRFSRSFTLPQGIDEENVEASYEDGVLSLTLPKTERSRSRKISISQSKGQERLGRESKIPRSKTGQSQPDQEESEQSA